MAIHDLVRQYWPGGWGPAPQEMLAGVPDSTDGHALGVPQRAGANLINLDRSWHYPEGVVNHAPVWTRHGVRVLAGPSVLWLDATGTRLPPPLFPGFDSLGAMRAITASGRAHSWFVTDMQTLGPEFSLSGSEQNPDITGKSVRLLISNRAGGKLQTAGAGVPRSRGRLPDGAHRARAGGEDERADRRAADRRGLAAADRRNA